jgi:uncharacterized OsmC-like protein
MTVRVGPEGISAVNGRGDEIRLAPSPSQHGFTPLELQSAALGICTAITLRAELARLADSPGPSSFELEVEGTKADDLPSRLATLAITVSLPDAVPAERRAAILHGADAACTIANTLRSRPLVAIAEATTPPGALAPRSR